MFPKSSLGTSGKLKKNRGNDMAEKGVNDATLRENLRDIVRHLKNGVYLSCMADSAYGQAIIWASERIAELEAESPLPETGSDHNRSVFFRFGYGYSEQEVVGEIKKLQLENEQLSLENDNLSKTMLKLSKSLPLASTETDEETHQRRRRKLMLDEITLSCVRGFLHGDVEGKTNQQVGASARDRAEDICHGIDEFDSRQ